MQIKEVSVYEKGNFTFTSQAYPSPLRINVLASKKKIMVQRRLNSLGNSSLPLNRSKLSEGKRYHT